MSELIVLTCPSCGANVQVSEDSSRFTCEYCGRVTLLKAQFVAPLRPKVPVPSVFKIERDPDAVRLVRRWFSLKYIPMAFFCVAWDAFLLFWYSIAFSARETPWIMIVFPVAHVAVGVGLTYSTLAGFVNKTVVELTRDELAVWFTPLPWLGETTVKTAELQQLYSKETRKTGNETVTFTYELHAVLKSGIDKKLVSDLDTPEAALYLEQTLEGWMKITDRPVAGELPRAAY